MKPWMENTVGSVALMLPRSGAACVGARRPRPPLRGAAAEALVQRVEVCEEAALAGEREDEERHHDPDHRDQERAVLPAERRLRAADQDVGLQRDHDQRAGQDPGLVGLEELPQLTSVLLWARLPPATSAGPSAKTEKNLAK